MEVSSPGGRGEARAASVRVGLRKVEGFIGLWGILQYFLAEAFYMCDMIAYSLHTSGLGESKGWWGVATHPGHLDSSQLNTGKFIKGTEWTVETHGAKTLSECKELLDKLTAAKKKLAPTC